MNRNIKLRINAGYALALLIMLFVSLISWRTLDELNKDRALGSHSRAIVEQLSRILSITTDAETGQRGYIITGQKGYLEPYQSAAAAIGPEIVALEKLTSDDLIKRKHVQALKALVSTKFDELGQTISAREVGGFDSAATIVENGRGEKNMDDIRDLITAMDAEDRQILNQQSRKIRKDVSNATLVIIIGSLLALVVVPVAGYLTTHEIARREQVEQDLMQAKEEAERTTRFKDQFLSTMSHELRTPLNAVLGFSDLLKEERYGPLNERQQRYLKHIHSGGEHLLKLINDILDLSKIEAGHMEIVLEDLPIADAFGEVILVLRSLAEAKRQDLSQSHEPGIAVRADATRLKQILTNLIGNAIKFTPEGGRIELSAESTDGIVNISVRDNGHGIPISEQQRVFDGFYRLRGHGRNIEGTGLGLAITQRLVGLHGSTLNLESHPGEGCCFRFALPLVRTFSTAGGSATGETTNTGKPTRILVIEDDPVAADLIHSYLTQSGYATAVCKESQRAFEIVLETQPQAITLDILMNPVNGWDLLVKLRNDPRTEKTPIIVVSIVDQRSLGLTLGADEYLVKPVEKESLLAAVERCLRGRKDPVTHGHILIVEDDEHTREVIAEVLRDQNYEVTVAVDGLEAREKVAQTLPQMVILDLILPKVSGFELLNEWRADSRTVDLPVFVLTSKDLTPGEETYLREHAKGLLHKHLHWQDALLIQVRRMVDRLETEQV